ncbi:hypothetical protein SNEBB_003118 [Seison nebaliae]|nr:hypothetical protein SNEBB_003118 [Seison nebaliae]
MENELKQRINVQLKRLTDQLRDIDEMSDSLSLNERNDLYESTIEQIDEFNKRLDREDLITTKESQKKLFDHETIKGNLKTQRRRISENLRKDLNETEQEFRLKKISENVYERRKRDLLRILSVNGEELKEEEIRSLRGDMERCSN